jgi:hypothetical protein
MREDLFYPALKGAEEDRQSKSKAERRPERFQAKWQPVRVKKTRQDKNLEPRFDSIETEKALGHFLRDRWHSFGSL